MPIPPGSFYLMRLIALFVLSSILFELPALANKTPYDWAFNRLDYTKQEKVEHLNRFTQRLHDFALKAAADKMVIAFFEMNRHFSSTPNPPASLINDVKSMRNNFNFCFFRRPGVDRRDVPGQSDRPYAHGILFQG